MILPLLLDLAAEHAALEEMISWLKGVIGTLSAVVVFLVHRIIALLKERDTERREAITALELKIEEREQRDA